MSLIRFCVVATKLASLSGMLGSSGRLHFKQSWTFDRRAGVGRRGGWDGGGPAFSEKAGNQRGGRHVRVDPVMVGGTVSFSYDCGNLAPGTCLAASVTVGAICNALNFARGRKGNTDRLTCGNIVSATDTSTFGKRGAPATLTHL